MPQTVVYADDNFEKEYNRLGEATNGDDKKVFSFMTRLRLFLRENYAQGTKVPKDKIPEIYATLVDKRPLWELRHPRYGAIRYTVVKGQLNIVDVV